MKTGVDHIGISTSFFCHDGSGRFLLHKRSHTCRDEKGVWDNGAGKLEFGLTLEQNVLKEVHEEYSCNGTIQEQLPAFTLLRQSPEGVPSHWIIIPFIILIQQSEMGLVRIGDPKKMAEMGWFTFNSLPHPLHPGFLKKVKQNSRIINKYIPSKYSSHLFD